MIVLQLFAGVIVLLLTIRLIFMLIVGVNMVMHKKEVYKQYWYVLYVLVKNNGVSSKENIRSALGISKMVELLTFRMLSIDELIEQEIEIETYVSTSKIYHGVKLTEKGKTLFEDNVETLRAAGWQTQLDELGL